MAFYFDMARGLMEGPSGTFGFTLPPISNVQMLVVPDHGPAWIERLPFSGRELIAATLADNWIAHYNQIVASQPEPQEPTIDERRQHMAATPWQVRKQARAAGLLATIDAAIQGTSDPDVIDWWNGYGQEVRRTSPTVITLMGQGGLGMTAEQIDEFFIAAMAQTM